MSKEVRAMKCGEIFSAALVIDKKLLSVDLNMETTMMLRGIARRLQPIYADIVAERSKVRMRYGTPNGDGVVSVAATDAAYPLYQAELDALASRVEEFTPPIRPFSVKDLWYRDRTDGKRYSISISGAALAGLGPLLIENHEGDDEHSKEDVLND